MNQIVIQGIGYLALLFIILSFQNNRRVKILLFMLVGLVLFVIHYSLLHAFTGALMNFIEAGMVFVGFKKECERWAQKKFWPYLFIVLFIAAGFITSKTLIDYFPVLAQIFGTIAVWQKSPKAIRYIMLLPRPLWFSYNWVVGSYAGMTTEVFILLSILLGIFRFDILGKARPSRKS